MYIDPMIIISKKIFSIAQTKDCLTPVHVETVSSNGLYKFEILGTGKNSNDLKQKIYTALRAEGAFNLKSDNRKIYISLFSKEPVVNTNNTELALLVSCYACVAKKDFWDGVMCIGRVGITGEVSETSKLIQTIAIAIDHQIQTIICPYDDFISLPTSIKKHIETNKLNIQPIRDIRSLLDKNPLKQNKPIAKPLKETLLTSYTHEEKTRVISTIQEDLFLWTLFVSMCGDHNILIYKDKTKDTEGIEKLIHKIHPAYSVKEIIQFSREFDLHDFEISSIPFFVSDTDSPLSKYKKSNIKKIYYIENCLCGNKDSDCTCSGRSKKIYRTKINTYIENTSSIKVYAQQQTLKPDEHTCKALQESICSIKNIHIDHEETFNTENTAYLEHVSEKLSACDKKTLFKVCLTLQKIDSFISTKTIPITKKTILLAFSLVKNKFQE